MQKGFYSELHSDLDSHIEQAVQYFGQKDLRKSDIVFWIKDVTDIGLQHIRVVISNGSGKLVDIAYAPDDYLYGWETLEPLREQAVQYLEKVCRMKPYVFEKL
ncbi:TPA: hypothetical protein HA239_00745 [Candidatus Woesearchaeota archaeon]|nr:hypothetical protein QT06_C0001G0188 [archaeon GW2011_AR15]MBS3104009.1 hypothetical protein [Candidatus Woesearchaeota archaeon]HIH40924.1 hypothetical protein [Candidatus Woesearchaeota archaeon]